MEQGNRGVEAGESTHPQGRCIQDALGVCSAFERRSNSDTVLLWLRAQGHGGQILLSESTRAHLHERVPPDARLRRLGAFTLRGLPGLEPISQVVVPDLPETFPAPRRRMDK